MKLKVSGKTGTIQSCDYPQLSRYLKEMFTFPSSYKFELLITGEPEVNARARLEESSSTYCIEFTLGLIVWLDGVAATLASHVAHDFADAPYPPLILNPEDEN